MAKSILLLDDSEIVRAAAAHCLERAGYAVTTVSSIDELEEKGNPQSADLILLDVEVQQLMNRSCVLGSVEALEGAVTRIGVQCTGGVDLPFQ